MTRETVTYQPGEPGLDRLPMPLPADPFPGEFRLVRRLGQGGFGEVWLAEDLSPLGRPVALKFLHPTEGTVPDARALELLREEARVLASLRHPHIVPIYAWRQAGGAMPPCLVLGYVPGGSLACRMRRDGPLAWQQATRYIADIGEGLLFVHHRGIIHRDVKPANMLHDPESDEALLTDFGIAARLGATASVAGTLPYMAPEAFQGQGSAALDVYGLAASLFWLVVGQTPFAGGSVTELLQAVDRGLAPRDPRFAVVPAPLERLMRAGLAAQPLDRPALAEFVAALRGGLNQLLTDCLAPASTAGPVQLRLLVWRQLPGGGSEPVAATTAAEPGTFRDLRRVPPSPGRVRLSSGERIRLEVVADQPGHVTVFNVGPTGNLNLLCPGEPGQPPPRLAAGVVLPILDVELTPPAGQERLFALWTRRPLPLQLDELHSLAGGAYRATRDLARVGQSLAALPPEDRHCVVLELDHV